MKNIIFFLLGMLAIAAGFFGFRFLNTHHAFLRTVLKKAPYQEEKLVIDPDSLQWQKATSTPHWQKRDSDSVFTFQDKLWLIGGLDSDNSKIDGIPNYEKAIYYNDIWNSADGVTWTRVREHADFPFIRSASVIQFKGVLYMYGGWSPDFGPDYKNGIWSSTDGLNWKKIVEKPEYPEREGQIVTEWNGKLWLVGGVNYFGRKTFNDVWYSEDGIHFTAATTNTPWHSRWDHAVGIINGKIVVAGGMNFAGVGYSDEWMSADGKVWKKVSPDPAWGERQGQEIVNFGGYSWLISGLHSASNEGKGDAWYTKDGIEWKKAPDDYQWLGREDHSVTVFGDKIFVMGGMDSDWNWNDDIWYSTFEKVTEESLKQKAEKTQLEKQKTPPELSAKAFISVLVNDIGEEKKVLAAKNENGRLPIASVTKLMTALVVREQLQPEQKITIISERIAGKGSADEIKAGETFSVAQLLHLLLIPSDNDAAYTFADTIGGEKFISLMNQKARAIGMSNTTYANPAGLDSLNPQEMNFSTAADLVKLTKYLFKFSPAVANQQDIIEISSYRMDTFTDFSQGITHTLTNTNKLLDKDFPFLVVGGKTGETPLAKKNLVLIAGVPNSDNFIISVVLNSDDNFGDMTKLLTWINDSQIWKK